jgi:nucleoside-diphosphate-sugar epimerase
LAAIRIGCANWNAWVSKPCGPTFSTLRQHFIALDDVADFAVAILSRDDVVNEVIEIGGPSNASFADFAMHVERTLGTRLKRKAVPAPVLRVGRHVVRPFHEVASRLMTMGYWTTLRDRPFNGWRAAAERFGISPRSLETFVTERFGPTRERPT